MLLMRLLPIAVLSICLVGSCAVVEDDPLPDETELSGHDDQIAPAAAIEPAAEQCGDVVCPIGTTCCDPLDGECVRKGMECPLGASEDPTADEAAAIEPAAEQCGDVVCPIGTTCCDPLDGECVRKGMECPL